MEDFLGFTGFLFAFLAAAFVLVGILTVAVVLLIAPFNDHGCHIYGGIANRPVKYSVYNAECYVKTPNGWFSKDQLNQNSVSH